MLLGCSCMTWTKKKMVPIPFGLSFILEDVVSMTQKQKEEEGVRTRKGEESRKGENL